MNQVFDFCRKAASFNKVLKFTAFPLLAYALVATLAQHNQLQSRYLTRRYVSQAPSTTTRKSDV